MFFPKAYDDVLQCQVDARGDESRRQSQTADLHLEASFAERVVIQQDSANVPQAFAQAAENHCNEEGPRSVSDAKDGVRNHEDSKEGGKKSIGPEVRVIAIN